LGLTGEANISEGGGAAWSSFRGEICPSVGAKCAVTSAMLKRGRQERKPPGRAKFGGVFANTNGPEMQNKLGSSGEAGNRKGVIGAEQPTEKIRSH